MGLFNQNNDYGYQNNAIPPYRNPQNFGFVNIMPVDNGAAWFVALAPVFSLFLEMIVANVFAAIFLWIFTYLLCVAVCVYDKNKILAKRFNVQKLNFLCVLPPVYLFARNSVTRRKNFCTFVCVCTLIIAFVNNGFVSFAMLDEDGLIETVKAAYSNDLMNFSEIDTASNNSISDEINDYFSDSNVKWSAEKGKKQSTITASTDTFYNGVKTEIEIEFVIYYDGFSYDGLEVTEIRGNGGALPDKDRDSLLMLIFSEEDTNNSSQDKQNYVEA